MRVGQNLLRVMRKAEECIEERDPPLEVVVLAVSVFYGFTIAISMPVLACMPVLTRYGPQQLGHTCTDGHPSR